MSFLASSERKIQLSVRVTLDTFYTTTLASTSPLTVTDTTRSWIFSPSRRENLLLGEKKR
jgi:hypothetical protein